MSSQANTIQLYSAIPFGYQGKLILVESDLVRGLPQLNIVGLASRSIDESRARIRSAIRNSGFTFPAQRITVNLAPADLKKNGAQLDLPIALAVLGASQQLLPSDLNKRLFVGELALDGRIRPVHGLINILETAKRNHIQEVFIPSDNANQAALANYGLSIHPVNHLRELWFMLKKLVRLSGLPDVVKNNKTDKHNLISLDQVVGQSLAKRALVVAVAGHHNLLLNGPPGTGKSLLAKAAHSLLPPLSHAEQIDVTKLFSLVTPQFDIAADRPFRSPHHNANVHALIGGGPQLLPGEFSLAHHGVLFLDELPEFSRDCIEALRTPLEDRQITLNRLGIHLTYPADFMLIATMNPCPCGFLGSATQTCSCSLSKIQAYRKKLSGPILDRIDLFITVSPTPPSVLLKNTTSSTHMRQTASLKIQRAIQRQFARNGDSTFNASLDSLSTSQLQISTAAKHLLNSAAKKLPLSTRAYFKIIRVARTIADLEPNNFLAIQPEHIAEALQYRQDA